MDQFRNFADGRLLEGCIYCGGAAETVDHVPSYSLLDPPYPENLPVVDACQACNQGFSKDEEYLVCLLEAAKAGSTDPEMIKRPSVARALRRSPALRARIEAAKRVFDDRIEFAVETDRVQSAMLKLARGHAAFELSQPCRREPNHFWCGPLTAMSPDVRELFDAPHEQKMFGEIGSRGLQRLLVTEMVLQSKTGEKSIARFLFNDWVDVQEGYYRYLAIDDVGGIVIRIVIAEYLAWEVGWRPH
ncbi:MAG: hypothetical protein WAO00_02415 [Chthoniobacterales bacterium]